MKKWIKADNGKVSQVLEFDDGERIEIPIAQSGDIKWFDDRLLLKKGAVR